MRELTLIGLDVDGKHLICEGGDPADKFLIRVDDRLRAAARGERSRPGQIPRDNEVRGVLRPKDIQARIRAGATVQEVADSSGMDVSKVERFAHPVLLERSRAAELATAAHPVLANGPAVETLLETINAALTDRGQGNGDTTWDSWRTEDGRWTIRMGWQAGLSENVAHFRFTPGAHGGTVTAIDEAASELIDPEFERPLRQVAPVAQLEFEVPAAPAAPAPVEQSQAAPQPSPQPDVQAPPRPAPKRTGRKPTVPAWEDELLGVRTSGER
ncbi:MAG: septation protein SepH [Mycobacteriaceae bacterium]